MYLRIENLHDLDHALLTVRIPSFPTLHLIVEMTNPSPMMFSCSSSCQPRVVLSCLKIQDCAFGFRGEPYFFMFLALAVALTQLALWTLESFGPSWST